MKGTQGILAKPGSDSFEKLQRRENSGRKKRREMSVRVRIEGCGSSPYTVTSTTPLSPQGDGGIASPGHPGFAFSVTNFVPRHH